MLPPLVLAFKVTVLDVVVLDLVAFGKDTALYDPVLLLHCAYNVSEEPGVYEPPFAHRFVPPEVAVYQPFDE